MLKISTWWYASCRPPIIKLTALLSGNIDEVKHIETYPYCDFPAVLQSVSPWTTGYTCISCMMERQFSFTSWSRLSHTSHTMDNIWRTCVLPFMRIRYKPTRLLLVGTHVTIFLWLICGLCGISLREKQQIGFRRYKDHLSMGDSNSFVE